MRMDAELRRALDELEAAEEDGKDTAELERKVGRAAAQMDRAPRGKPSTEAIAAKVAAAPDDYSGF
ncbi:MAG TPA: hypothetical protein VLH75_20505 [Longimicrobiales bacterium]|nr:hypothetical protein [Longimicrobiales bacterium]